MSSRKKPRKDAYKGFLYLECPKCGAARGFFVREYTYNFLCHACDSVMELRGMHQADAICECGKRWRYLTNSKRPMIELSCVRCHAPITLARQRDGYYKTIERG